MILYDLQCAGQHRFEGWFKDAKSCDRQAKAGLIACPVCGGTQIEQAPMAPNIAVRGEEMARSSARRAEHMEQMLDAVHRHVEGNFDYVGDEFAEEARRIHYGEAEERGIYGEATPQDARDLIEEGIGVLPLPKSKKKKH